MIACRNASSCVFEGINILTRAALALDALILPSSQGKSQFGKKKRETLDGNHDFIPPPIPMPGDEFMLVSCDSWSSCKDLPFTLHFACSLFERW